MSTYLHIYVVKKDPERFIAFEFVFDQNDGDPVLTIENIVWGAQFDLDLRSLAELLMQRGWLFGEIVLAVEKSRAPA